MNKLERKTVILIIAIIVTLLLATTVVVLSVLTNGGNTHKPSPTANPAPKISAPVQPTGGTVNDENIPTPQATPGEKETPPPANAYNNNYSHDTGYKPLPSDFNVNDKSQYPNTVFDPAWAVTKANTLMCELSTKPTITEKAIQPIKDFVFDLNRVHTKSADALTATLNQYLNDYEPNIGQRASGSDMAALSIHCESSNED